MLKRYAFYVKIYELQKAVIRAKVLKGHMTSHSDRPHTHCSKMEMLCEISPALETVPDMLGWVYRLRFSDIVSF